MKMGVFIWAACTALVVFTLSSRIWQLHVKTAEIEARVIMLEAMARLPCAQKDEKAGE